MTGPFLYKCPNTGLYVQGWSGAESENLQVFEIVACPLCKLSHLINVRTGRVVGEKEPASMGSMSSGRIS
jgi:hypothetical protein